MSPQTSQVERQVTNDNMWQNNTELDINTRVFLLPQGPRRLWVDEMTAQRGRVRLHTQALQPLQGPLPAQPASYVSLCHIFKASF